MQLCLRDKEEAVQAFYFHHLLDVFGLDNTLMPSLSTIKFLQQQIASPEK